MSTRRYFGIQKVEKFLPRKRTQDWRNLFSLSFPYSGKLRLSRVAAPRFSYSAVTARRPPGVGFPPLRGWSAPVDLLKEKDRSPDSVLTNRCAPSAEKATSPGWLAILTGEPAEVICPDEFTVKIAILFGCEFATATHGPLLATSPGWPPECVVPLLCPVLLAIGLAFTVPAPRSVQMR